MEQVAMQEKVEQLTQIQVVLENRNDVQKMNEQMIQAKNDELGLK